MILTEKTLAQLEESMLTTFTAEQRQIMLERFGTEPGPHVWTEQDIAEQIKRICLECPAF